MFTVQCVHKGSRGRTTYAVWPALHLPRLVYSQAYSGSARRLFGWCNGFYSISFHSVVFCFLFGVCKILNCLGIRWMLTCSIVIQLHSEAYSWSDKIVKHKMIACDCMCVCVVWTVYTPGCKSTHSFGVWRWRSLWLVQNVVAAHIDTAYDVCILGVRRAAGLRLFKQTRFCKCCRIISCTI